MKAKAKISRQTLLAGLALLGSVLAVPQPFLGYHMENLLNTRTATMCCQTALHGSEYAYATHAHGRKTDNAPKRWIAQTDPKPTTVAAGSCKPRSQPNVYLDGEHSSAQRSKSATAESAHWIDYGHDGTDGLGSTELISIVQEGWTNERHEKCMREKKCAAQSIA
ncbi:hypothetical protein SERLA73DRAFT_163237 [Serpula lacrymans var. lacrymans S7.3]|uniref:SCP domain-containing protein n=1 Tax=Serpula lacrymans var. lacrymans (strain S7.3) TaxID=936435 RepID=F8QCC6_SERL3|nr:hypothetical protein SERLA73DRAFT_163237 [Serpula lacrymans var. lacrymans S7.3]